MSSIEHMIGEENARKANEGVGGEWHDPSPPAVTQADITRIAPRSRVKLGTLPDTGKVKLDCVNFR